MVCRLLCTALAFICLTVYSPVYAQGSTPDFPVFDPTGMTTVSGETLHGPGDPIDRTTRRGYPLRVGRVWQGNVNPQFRSGYNGGVGWPGGITMGQSWSDPTNSEHWGAYLKVSGGMVGCRNWTAALPTSQNDPTPVDVSYPFVNGENVRYGYSIDTKMLGDFTVEQGSGQTDAFIGYSDLESAMIMRWHPPQVVVNGTHLLSYAPSYGPPGSSASVADANFGEYRGVVDPTLRSECVVYHGFRMVSGVDVFRAIHQYGTYPDNNYLLYDYNFVNSGNCDEDLDLEHPAPVYDLRVGMSEQHYSCHITEQFNINRDDDALEYINPWPGYTDGSGEHRQAVLFYDVDGLYVPGPDWGDPYGAFEGTEQTTGTNCYARGYVGKTMVFAEMAAGSGVDDPAEPRGMTWYKENELRLGRELCGWDQGVQYRYAYTGKNDPNDIASARMWPENTPITGEGSDKGHTTVISTAPGDLALNDVYHCVYGIAIAGLNNRESKDIAFRTLRRDADGIAPANRQTAEEIALIQSGRDSVLAAMDRMFWNIHGFDPNGNIPDKPAERNQAYNVPDAPRPPACFWVENGTEQIFLEWSNESDAPDFDTGINDFAGYRVYRAEASPDSDWVPVYDGTANEFEDTDVSAGVTYFYAVTAYDDGTQNWESSGKSVESGMFWNWSGWGYCPGTIPLYAPGGTQIYPSVSLISGTITDEVWTAEFSPYFVTDPCILAAGDQLTIEAGVDVFFEANVPFIVQGALHVHGTQDNNVRFLPKNQITTPQTANLWGGIRISGGDSSYFSHTVISGAYATGSTREDSCGGGLHISGSDTRLVMENCRISENYCAWSGAGIKGADSAWAVFNNCSITGNHAAHDGGGLYNNELCDITFNNCEITGNSAGDDGGGMDNSGGIVTLANCTISGNAAADDAGGVGNHADVGRATLTNCVIAHNTAAVDGGGIRNTGSAVATLTACTVANNTAATGGAIYNEKSATATFRNCILWENEPYEIFVAEGTVDVTYCCTEQRWFGTGNHSSDPLFINASSGNYSLLPGSPCIDTGDPAMYDPDGTRADMGAFYVPHSVDIDAETPHSLSLSQNAPNPFNPVTTIEFALPEAGVTNLVIYDVTGRQVRTLVSGTVEAGMHSVAWDGRDAVGRPAASGVYMYRLTTSEGNLVKRMTLIR